MIGQTIESRPRFQLGFLLWLLLAASLDALALYNGSSAPALFSVQPWLVCVFLWYSRPRPFVARFTDAALEVEMPPQTIPYADLQGLLAPRRPGNPFKAGPRRYAMQVLHVGGVLSIPAALNVHSDEVYSFLYGRFSPGGSHNVPSLLHDYLRRKERLFGAERVWTYGTRVHLGKAQQLRPWKAFFLALLLAGIVWLCWGILQQNPDWIGGGISAIIFGSLFSLLFWLLVGSRPTVRFVGLRKWRQSGLVISPDGLALAQGDLVGELRWEELRDVSLSRRRPVLWTDANQHMPGILLKVEGAALLIADIYDRPLALIYQNIRHYWQGEGRSEEDERTLPSSAREQFHPADSPSPPPKPSPRITPAE